MSIYCQQSVASCERSRHANIHSFRLITETRREWWLAGSAYKCGYRGPQILTECQVPRNYWCTQPAIAPDTSQTESLNVTDKWIFMKLERERKSKKSKRRQNERQDNKKKEKNRFHTTGTKACGISSLKRLANVVRWNLTNVFWVTKVLKCL